MTRVRFVGALFVAACTRPMPEAPKAPAPARAVPQAPAPVASSSAAAEQATAPSVPDKPALFVRAADTLMPLVCGYRGIWGHAQICVNDADRKSVRLDPPLKDGTEEVRGTPALVYFMQSNTHEPGLLMPGFRDDPSTVARPFLGFGVMGVTNRIRFTPAGLARLKKGKEWCPPGKCREPDLGSVTMLPFRTPPEAVTSAARASVMPAVAAKTSERPPTFSVISIGVQVSGHEEQLIVLELKLSDVPASGGLPPAEGHFLVAQHDDTFQHLPTFGAYTEGFGEAGELLAAIDLDADGTDELLLEWRYSEGRWYRIAQRRGDRLVVLGEFGMGF